MRNILLIILCWFSAMLAVQAQTVPTITLSTDLAVGSSITFAVEIPAATTVNVDFGNGTLKSWGATASTTTIDITGTIVGSQTVKIYATNFYYFDCKNSQVTTLDVSKATALNTLYCGNNHLSSLDVSSLTALVNLQCYGNQLTTLDVTKNTALEMLDCENNLFTSIDISKNTALKKLFCRKNFLNLSSMPNIPSSIDMYYYAPQKPVDIEDNISLDETVDLATQAIVGSVATVYTWKTKAGATLVEGTDYTITEGKTTFLKAQDDSVYCEMTNATFPSFTGSDVLKTTLVKVTEKFLVARTISFTALPATLEFGKSYDLSATASTGAAVTFTSSDPSVASVSGTTLTIHKAGSVTITATVAATDLLASAEATQTLSIAPVTAIGTAERSECVLYPTVATECITLSGAAVSSPAKVQVFNAQGMLVLEGSLQQGRLDVSALPAGQYLLKTNSAADQQTHRFVKQ